jgi:hypothetical protein
METALLTLVVLEAVVIAVLAVLVFGLLRSHADILRSLHRLGAGDDPEASAVPLRTRPGVPPPRLEGTAAADLSGSRPGGGAVKVAVVGVEHQTLLAFLTSGCVTCAGFWKAFGEERRLPPGMRLVVVTKGPEAESESTVAALAPPGVTVAMSGDAWDHYRVPVAPYFILVDGPSGRVTGEGAAATWRQMASLLERARADGVMANGPAADRETRDLLAGGIGPGHPSLYPAPERSDDTPADAT